MSDEHQPSEEQPRVGIYWGIPDESGAMSIIVDASLIRQAEPYGDFLTHSAGHYDVWEAWRRLGPVGLARLKLPNEIVIHEYEDFPRGRVVYDGEQKRFVIYADRKLQTPDFIAEIVRAFGLQTEPYVVKSDLHYRSRLQQRRKKPI